MRDDKRRISDIRNLNYKPGRRLFYVAAFLLMASFFCVPALAGGEWLEYAVVFDNNNSVAVVRLSRSVTYYGDGVSFPETVDFDNILLSRLVDGTISFFKPEEIDTIVGYAQSNGCSQVDLNCSVTLLYRHLNDDTATFPVPEATTFNCKSFHCSVNVLRGSNAGGLESGQTFSFKYRVPGSSNWVSDSATATDDMVLISRYIDNVSDGVYYTNSIALSELSTVFKFTSSATNNFVLLLSPKLSFSFSNIYQYSIPAETGTESAPETTYSGFSPGVDTVVPSDTMQGNPDDIDNVLDDRYQDFVNNYTDILNGFSWVKYASCFGFIGQFFGKVFQFEPFSDILNSWAIFAVFNILLGGFITGVSAFVRSQIRENEKKEREAQNEIRREKMRGFWSRFYRNFGNGRGRHHDE